MPEKALPPSLPAFELVSPAPGEVLPALLSAAAVGLSGLGSFAPGPPVVFLRSSLVPVRDSAPVACVMLPFVALASLPALTSLLSLLLVLIG